MGVDVLNHMTPNLPKKQLASKSSKKRAPTSKPPFTLGQLKSLVPPHCFQRSLPRSLFHLIHDLVIIAVLSYVAVTYIPLLPWPVQWLAWPLHWVATGTVAFGLWFLGHELGHQAFSEYEWLNDTIGFLVHSSMLVPYQSWKFSHHMHHVHTGSLEKDVAHLPRQKPSTLRRYLNSPVGRIFFLLLILTVGWPLYLICNLTGRKYSRFNSFLDPNAPMYPPRMRLQVHLANAGVLAMAAILAWLAHTQGLAWLAAVYWGPLVVVNAWLVTITLTNHVHPSLPHYAEGEWDWLRGTITSTVDRDFGWFLNYLFHNTPNVHMMHHLFPKMPHYRLQEATDKLRPILGDYYQRDTAPPHKALYEAVKECVFVKEDVDKRGVFWYSALLEAMIEQ
nr:PREDICTED: delta(12) fatty acid desaturase FAD2-like [Bemisia tabaci]